MGMLHPHPTPFGTPLIPLPLSSELGKCLHSQNRHRLVASCQFHQVPTSGAVARTLIGRGGGIFIYSGYVRLTSFEINFISKETSRAEPEYTPPPPN